MVQPVSRGRCIHARKYPAHLDLRGGGIALRGMTVRRRAGWHVRRASSGGALIAAD